MLTDEIAQLSTLKWIPSRIPARKALVAFLPDGPECPPAIKAAMQEQSGSRWFPVDGGHRVLFLYEGGAYDTSTFHVEPDAWDYEDCAVCAEQIPALNPCFVTELDPYIALCPACYRQHVS